MTTFPAVQTIVISDVSGSLIVHGSEQPNIQVESASTIEQLQPRGDTLSISDIEGDLHLSVPHETSVIAKDIQGNAHIEHVGRVDLKDVGCGALLSLIHGDMYVIDIGGTVEVRETNGTVSIKDVGSSATLKGIGGNVTLTGVGKDASLSGINGSVTVKDIGTSLLLENVDGSVQASDVGTTLTAQEIRGNVTLHDIGNNLVLTNIGGTVQVTDVGNSATFTRLSGTLTANDIGGNLSLLADLVPGRSSISVGGNATITIPKGANLTLTAQVGGNVTGSSMSSSSSSGSHTINVTYGTGVALLELEVGGNLVLHSDESPRSSSSASGFTYQADIPPVKDNRGKNISEAVSNLNVRINEREWQLDPQRLDRLVEQAKQAATDGVQGALEAVEQALSNIRMPAPKTAPKPPVPPKAPMSPMEPMRPIEPMKPMAPMQPIKPIQPMAPIQPMQSLADVEESKAQTQHAPEMVVPLPSDPAQERMAILRMIAEGRITPDEGDLLLEALGN